MTERVPHVRRSTPVFSEKTARDSVATVQMDRAKECDVVREALRWLDRILRDEVRALRRSHAQPIEEFQGLFVSDDRVDQLLAGRDGTGTVGVTGGLTDGPTVGATFGGAVGPTAGTRNGATVGGAGGTTVGETVCATGDVAVDTTADATADATADKTVNTTAHLRLPESLFDGSSTVWSRLRAKLALTEFECAVVILTVAPELDLKYETVYAYLNNDITRRWVTRDLALRLFSRLAPSEHHARAHLSTGASLFRHGVLRPIPAAPDHPAWRASGFTIDSIAAHALLSVPPSGATAPQGGEVDTTQIAWDALAISPAIREQLRRLPKVFSERESVVRSMNADDTHTPSVFPLLIFEGRPGNEQHRTACALATALDTTVLSLDVRTLGVTHDRVIDTIRAAILYQILYRSVVVIHGLDTLRETDQASAASVRTIVSALARAVGPVIVVCDDTAGREFADVARSLIIRFELPSAQHRARLWTAAVESVGLRLSAAPELPVASRFMLTPGQIRHAVHVAADEYRLLSETDTHAPIPETHLFEAARAQTRIGLGALARRVNCAFGFDDLVLPEATAQQIREISAAIRCRTTVYDEWDFARRLPQGQGLKVLFSGPSGTGKTMAAAVIAREVGLDLYAIDLSGIVSKYIGETEKNLDRVFKAAQCANAILFFDECDALFGKRSEVKDAHDRYANIEVAYLLQQMESHDGAVILATNFSRNMDLAFSRRMQYVVEFSIPDVDHREQLWRRMFPERAPLSDDIDFPFLARQFPLAGGDIRNVALDAAFLAAQNGRVITMQHLVRAMARQVSKQGQAPSPTHFKHYFSLLSRER